MKKYLIISLAFGFILTSCKKSALPQANDAFANGKYSPSSIIPNAPCIVYRVYNPRGPVGTRVIYEYTDCNGVDRTGLLDAFQFTLIAARPGTMRCPGGIVSQDD